MEFDEIKAYEWDIISTLDKKLRERFVKENKALLKDIAIIINNVALVKKVPQPIMKELSFKVLSSLMKEFIGNLKIEDTKNLKGGEKCIFQKISKKD